MAPDSKNVVEVNPKPSEPSYIEFTMPGEDRGAFSVLLIVGRLPDGTVVFDAFVNTGGEVCRLDGRTLNEHSDGVLRVTPEPSH